MKVLVVTFVAAAVLIANVNCNACGAVGSELVGASASDGGNGGGGDGGKWGGDGGKWGGDGGNWGGDGGSWGPGGGAGGWVAQGAISTAVIDGGVVGCGGGDDGALAGLGGGLAGGIGGGFAGGLGGGLGDGGAASILNGGGSSDLYRVYGQPINISPEATSIVVPACPVVVKPVMISQGAPVSVNPTILTKSAPAQVQVNPVAIKLLRQFHRPARTLVVQAPSCGCGDGGCSGGH